MAYGVTTEGFVLKNLTDILAEKRALAVSLFQELVPEGESVDTSDSSLLGRLISLVSPSEADLWQAMLATYQAFDPDQAFGESLDNIVALSGLTRFVAKSTTVQCLFELAPATSLTTAAQVSSDVSGKRFTLTEPLSYSLSNASSIKVGVLNVQNSTAYTITYKSSSTSDTPVSRTYTSDASATQDEILNGIVASFASDVAFTATRDGNVVYIKSKDALLKRDFTITSNLSAPFVFRSATVECTETGIVTQAISSVNTIDTPVIGWNSVTNPVAGVAGNDLETDEELRIRFKQNKARTSTGTVTALYSALTALNSVAEVKVVENDTNATDSNGLPAKSFMCIVDGGNSSDIANAIWQKKPAGVLAYGNTTVSVVDSQGFSHDISFQRVADVNIYINVSISTYTGAPPTATADIKAALIAYIDALKIGDDVVYSRLYTPINTVAGVQVNSLAIGTSPSPTGTSNIPVSLIQKAFTQNSFINVTVV